MRYVNMQPSPVAVSLPTFFLILPSPASTHPLLPSLPPTIALGLAHGQPDTRICCYMTWMLLQQWLKRPVCQQAAHTYGCIVLSRPSLTLFFSNSFVWLGFCLHTIVRPCLLRWLCGHLGSGELYVFFQVGRKSVWRWPLSPPPPEQKDIKLVAKCVFPKGLWCKGKVILGSQRRKERGKGGNDK